MTHVPGAKNKVADGLSRYPADPAELLNLPDDVATIIKEDQFSNFPISDMSSDTNYPEAEECTMAATLASFQASPITSTTWDLVRTGTVSDEALKTLMGIIEAGFPDTNLDLPQKVRHYYRFRDQLSTVDGVIIYNDRVLIPPSLRPNVLATLHAAHQGTSTMISRAESSVFWPGITNDIINVRDCCHHCNKNAPSNPRGPPIPSILPETHFSVYVQISSPTKGYHM